MKTLRDKRSKELLERYNEIEKRLEPFKELLKEQKTLKQELIKLSEEKADDILKAGGFLMSIKRSIQKRFNQKLFIDLNGPESLDQYKREVETVSITVKQA